MSKRLEIKNRPKKPEAESDPFVLVDNVATRLFRHVSESFDGMIVVTYRRKSAKKPGEISSTMLATKRLNATHRKFLRELIADLPDNAGL